MTVKKMIELLQRVHSPDAQVRFSVVAGRKKPQSFGLVARGRDHFHYHWSDKPFLEICLEPERKKK